jgi:hypothetical protein
MRNGTNWWRVCLWRKAREEGAASVLSRVALPREDGLVLLAPNCRSLSDDFPKKHDELSTTPI